MIMDTAHLTANWKTTVQSVLTTTLGVTSVLTASSLIKPHSAAILVTFNGIAKIVLGLFQKDATNSVSTTPAQ